MTAEPRHKIRIVDSIEEIPAATWDGLATADAANDAQGPPGNPFLSHDFLSALEDSGCVGGRTGWQPRHLVLEGPAGVEGLAPCYLKSHSYGEYVFDHAWADAYARAGGRYYPKLQIAVPFTPVTGPRLLVTPGPEAPSRRRMLALGAVEVARRLGASSAHITFPTEAEWQALGGLGFLQRTDQQFHWVNAGYASFDDFLAALASRKRKIIRRERRDALAGRGVLAGRDALAGGLAVEWVTGRDLTEAHWDAFFAFYMDTGSRKWGRPYLNRKFFSLIGERMPERIALVFAKRGGRPIAGALNLIGDGTLYGRYWGCIEDHPFLHFELCYYQAIEFAITRGLARVEAGAQGEHKLARGYMPSMTYSAHWIADPALARAVADYLGRERAAVAFEQEALEEHAPYRRGSQAPETEEV